MAADPSRVSVTSGSTGTGTGPSGQMQANHRDFPEIRAEGKDAADAAGQLVNHLTRALDSALTTWRRDTIQAAIADVEAFRQSPPA